MHEHSVRGSRGGAPNPPEGGEDQKRGCENEEAHPGRGRPGGDGAQADVQVGAGVDGDGPFEGQHPPLLGDAGAEGSGTADGGVLLLDEPFGQPHEGGVVVGGVAVDDGLGVLLGVTDFLAAVEVAELRAECGGVPGGGGLADIQPHQGLLELDVVELDTGVFVEGGIVRGEAIGGLEGPAGLLRVALLEGIVAGGQEVFGLACAFELAGGFVLEIGLQVEGRARTQELFLLELERAGAIPDTPLVAEADAPGNVLQREIEPGGQQFEVQRAPGRRADARAVEKLDWNGLVAARLLFERDEQARGPAPGPNAAVVDEGKPEAGVLGQGDIEQALVARLEVQPDLGEHDGVVRDD